MSEAIARELMKKEHEIREKFDALWDHCTDTGMDELETQAYLRRMTKKGFDPGIHPREPMPAQSVTSSSSSLVVA